MSLTINRIGGSSGVSENNAILMVHVPTASTVTASKGGVTLTPKMWVSGSTADEDVAMFIFSPAQFDSVNPWTITATDGEFTKSKSVLITTNKEYEVALHYRLYIIKNGIWQIDDSTVTKTSVTTTQQTGYIQEKTSGNVVGGIISPSLDITPYDSIILTVETGSLSWCSNQCPALGLSASIPSIDGQTGAVTPYDDFQLMNSTHGPINAGTYTLAISSYSGTKYLWITCSGYGSNLGIVNIVDWYLA